MQYIDKPYELLDDVLNEGFDVIVIDRTPFSKSQETIKLQVVPPSIYEASYPCWFFNESKFLNYLANKNYKLIEQFGALDGENEEYKFKGFIFEKAML